MAGLILLGLLGGDLSDLIDRHLERGWRDASVTPARPTTDPEFLRRVTFDLAGRPPTPAEVRAFLADESPGKRIRRIDALLSSPDYAGHWAAVWEEILVGRDPEFLRATGRSLYIWLRDEALGRNLPYDRMVAALIGARGVSTRDGPSSFIGRHLALGGPEAIAGAVSRIFLGIRIQCAQCHDHPFDVYSQDDFFGMAAFFVRVRSRKVDTMRPQDMSRELYDSARGEMTSAGSVYEPVFLDGTRAGRRRDRRRELARILSADERLPRALVNRAWSILFGRGIVEPPDDISPRHRPSHPGLLRDLAAAFVADGYDLKALLRGITASRAYQLASARSGDPVPDRLFAVSRPRPLRDDQLANALSSAIGTRLDGRVPVEADALRRALLFMNNPELHRRIGPGNRLITSLIQGRDTPPDRLEGLYLGILGRFPHPDESARYVDHLRDGGRGAVEDVAWVLINSSEFLHNH